MNYYIQSGKVCGQGRGIRIRIIYDSGRAGISVKNRIKTPGQYVQGTGIGMKNVALMMEQMDGELEVVFSGTRYRVELYFPVKEIIHGNY